MRAALLLLLALVGAGPAAGDRAGLFDYYLLAVSWSPSWCAREGDARGAEACEAGAGHGWTLHGLWPQHEAGWPEWCEPAAPGPGAAAVAGMAEIMGSPTLAAHQWRKHGTCSGLAGEAYLALSRAAFAGVALPEPAARVTAAALADAVLEANPAMPQDAIAVTCREGMVAEVRICLDRALGFRSCGRDVLERACAAGRSLEAPPPR